MGLCKIWYIDIQNTTESEDKEVYTKGVKFRAWDVHVGRLLQLNMWCEQSIAILLR